MRAECGLVFPYFFWLFFSWNDLCIFNRRSGTVLFCPGTLGNRVGRKISMKQGNGREQCSYQQGVLGAVSILGVALELLPSTPVGTVRD